MIIKIEEILWIVTIIFVRHNINCIEYNTYGQSHASVARDTAFRVAKSIFFF